MQEEKTTAKKMTGGEDSEKKEETITSIEQQRCETATKKKKGDDDTGKKEEMITNTKQKETEKDGLQRKPIGKYIAVGIGIVCVAVGCFLGYQQVIKPQSVKTMKQDKQVKTHTQKEEKGWNLFQEKDGTQIPSEQEKRWLQNVFEWYGESTENAMYEEGMLSFQVIPIVERKGNLVTAYAMMKKHKLEQQQYVDPISYIKIQFNGETEVKENKIKVWKAKKTENKYTKASASSVLSPQRNMSSAQRELCTYQAKNVVDGDGTTTWIEGEKNLTYASWKEAYTKQIENVDVLMEKYQKFIELYLKDRSFIMATVEGFYAPDGKLNTPTKGFLKDLDGDNVPELCLVKAVGDDETLLHLAHVFSVDPKKHFVYCGSFFYRPDEEVERREDMFSLAEPEQGNGIEGEKNIWKGIVKFVITVTAIFAVIIGIVLGGIVGNITDNNVFGFLAGALLIWIHFLAISFLGMIVEAVEYLQFLAYVNGYYGTASPQRLANVGYAPREGETYGTQEKKSYFNEKGSVTVSNARGKSILEVAEEEERKGKND